jgi:hypothetical protein
MNGNSALQDNNNDSDLERTIPFYRTMTLEKNGNQDRLDDGGAPKGGTL